MKRRAFIKALVGGVATVAIGMRVSRGMPELLADGYEYKTVSMGFTLTKEEALAYAEEVHGKGVYGAIGRRYADALAKSMRQTREHVASNVLEQAFGQ